MKRLVCAVAAVGLIVTTCFSHLSAFAESKDGNLVIDLNASEDCETDSESLEDISNVPIIVYELGDPRVPVIDNDTMGDSNILEESVARWDFPPTKYHDLSFKEYIFEFVYLRDHVYTGKYFKTDDNGYIAMSTNQISDPVRILMMEYSTNEVVHTWEGDPQSIAGLGFYGGLSKYYYFRFEPYNVGSVNGSGSIFWDD